jgi:hypothetical protein
MSSAPPPDDEALAAAVRIQRRRHRWALAAFWCLMLWGSGYAITSDADGNGAPPPSWFTGLTDAFGVGVVVAMGVVIGYTVAMRRCPPQAQTQAIALEKQRLRRQGFWDRVTRVILGLALVLAVPVMLGCAFFGVTWILDGAARLAGDGPPVGWAATSITSTGDAAIALIIGLLFVGGGVLLVFAIYRRATRRWWPRYLQRRASRLGGLS